MIWKTYDFTLHTLLLNIDHIMIHPCHKYVIYIILILFVEFTAIVKLIHQNKLVTLLTILFMSV